MNRSVTERQQLSIVAMCGVAAIILLIILALQGCGTWQESAGKTLASVHELAKAASAKAEPGYRAKCGKVARACKGLPCEALEACQAERRKVNAAIKLTHASVKALTEALPLIEEVSK